MLNVSGDFLSRNFTAVSSVGYRPARLSVASNQIAYTKNILPYEMYASYQKESGDSEPILEHNSNIYESKLGPMGELQITFRNLIDF